MPSPSADGHRYSRIKLRPTRPAPPPVDPEALDPASRDRREARRAEREDLEQRSKTFVPANQRNVKRDAQGRIVTKGWERNGDLPVTESD